MSFSYWTISYDSYFQVFDKTFYGILNYWNLTLENILVYEVFLTIYQYWWSITIKNIRVESLYSAKNVKTGNQLIQE